MLELIIAIVTVLRFAAPVAFSALGECIGQRAGIINIGLEGLMLTAAYVAAVVTQVSGSPWVGIAVGTAAAVALGLLQCFFTLALAADQIVVGTAVNLLAMGLTNTLYRARYGQTGSLISLPPLPRSFAEVDAVIVLLVAATVYAALMLTRTKRGLLTRAAGENPEAVEAAGFSAFKVRLWAVVFASVMAGIGGAYLAVGVTGSFSSGMTAGRGFVAIAMVTFGRWRPIWVLAATVLVGYSEQVQYLLQARQVAVPGELLQAMPYLFALIVLFIAGKGTSIPARLAIPHRREK